MEDLMTSLNIYNHKCKQFYSRSADYNAYKKHRNNMLKPADLSNAFEEFSKTDFYKEAMKLKTKNHPKEEYLFLRGRIYTGN
jgi:hypothetical protein